MVNIIEAPEDFQDIGNSLFLAGGIFGCPDWQQEMISLLADLPMTLLNPRRCQFSMNDPSQSRVQIEWEHRALRISTAILFWFPCETLCPIALYELGAWSMTQKPLFIGVHPDYPRKADIEIQTGLVRPNVEIVGTLESLARQVKQFAAHA